MEVVGSVVVLREIHGMAGRFKRSFADSLVEKFKVHLLLTIQHYNTESKCLPQHSSGAERKRRCRGSPSKRLKGQRLG